MEWYTICLICLGSYIAFVIVVGPMVGKMLKKVAESYPEVTDENNPHS